MKKLIGLLLVVVLASMVSAAITSPNDIPGLYVQLDADSLALTDGAPVTAWTDLKNGIVFGGTAKYRTNYANGHAAVKFGGLSEGLYNINLLGTPGSPLMSGVTLFMVANVDLGGGYLCEGNNPSGTRMRINADNGASAKNYQVRVGGGASTSGGILDNAKHIYTIVAGQPAPASKMYFLMDGAVAIDGGASYNIGALQMNGFSVGCAATAGSPTSGAVCSIAEVLLYSAALTNEQITDVNSYLTQKYQITPPPSNPVVTPVDDGTGIDATLAWTASSEPGDSSVIYSKITKQYVYMSKDQKVVAPAVADPNIYYFGEGTVVSGRNSMINANNLHYDGTYKWAVVEVLTGHGYTPTVGVSLLAQADPNNIIGPTWTFTAPPADTKPIVDAGSSYVTWLANLPQAITGTVSDSGEGDIIDPNVMWSVTASPAGSIYSLVKTSTNPLAPTATFTADTVGNYTITLTVLDLAKQVTTDTMVIKIAADPCAAAYTAGRTSYYDTNKDCVVNMTDFAAFAVQWLTDITLTGVYAY